MTLSYDEALSFLNQLPNFETLRDSGSSIGTFTLARIEALLDGLGRPERRFPTVHVTGTKGKGSTASMIASILTASGKTVGLYTSPHFHSVRERIVIDRTPVLEEEFAETMEEIRAVIEKIGMETPSYFEALTTLAFTYFAQKKVDFAVIEVGIGGTFDATNVLIPRVSVITSVSLDHTAVLGKSLSEIASHKAGIVKERGVLVSAPQKPEVMHVFEDRCKEQHANLIYVGKNHQWEKGPANLDGQTFFYRYRQEFRIPLLGDHQIENACTAIEAIEILRGQGIHISDEMISAGLRSVSWPGRFQILAKHPFLVVDGAHNRSSAICLQAALETYFQGRERVIIVGTSCDKDIQGILEGLLPGTKLFIATRSDHPRSAEPELIEEIVEKLGGRARKSKNLSEAIHDARDLISLEGVICVTGSLFLVGETIKAELCNRRV